MEQKNEMQKIISSEPLSQSFPRSLGVGKLAEALAKAQSEMESAKKDSMNPHFKNKYADIASIIDAVRAPLAKHGLSYVQFVEDDFYLVTLLMHTSGEWISGRMKLILMKHDMQGLGSAITYARRYGLSAMVGIAQDDDDGNAASHQKHPEKPTSNPAPVHWKINKKQYELLLSAGTSRGMDKLQTLDYIGTKYNTKNVADISEAEYNECLKFFQPAPLQPFNPNFADEA